MEREVHDLAVLKLAELYERAYEHFVTDVAGHLVEDEDVRRLLSDLTPPEDDHRTRIAREIQRLTADLGPEEKAKLVRAALLDVREIERASREFYARHAERVRDSVVADLFAELADEENGHVLVAEEALRLLDEKEGRTYEEAELSTLQVVRPARREDALPLREGVSDYGGRTSMRGPGGER